MKTKNTRKGFTTVELVIVIAVIAILATVLIPTFSNMIEKANLSVDTQNVRNMNMVLLTHMFDEAEDFGSMKAQLVEGGYGKDANFIPKTKGYKYYWYVDKVVENGNEKDISVILLVNENGDAPTVEYPEEYTNVSVNTLSNPYVCFDLSLPAAVVECSTEPKPASGIDALAWKGAGQYLDAATTLTTTYTFTANTEVSNNYNDWYADFYITYEGDLSGVTFAGFYQYFADNFIPGMGDGWVLITDISQVFAMIGNPEGFELIGLLDSNRWTYELVQEYVGVFECGLVDEEGGTDAGSNIRVELRLTNPDDENDIKIIGVFEYTFQ